MSTPGLVGSSSSVARMTIRVASTWSTTPARRAAMAAPESRATTASMPVPTNGASACTSGTAWRCMFEPMRARFASSFSRNGMSAAATETSCFGDTSMRSTRSGATTMTSPAWRQTTRSSVSLPLSSIGGVRLGDVVLRLLHGREVDRPRRSPGRRARGGTASR